MTTITPPLTGSYAATLQGINVSRFDLFGISVSPKMGRNGMSTFLSSSDEIIDVSSDARSFFDDSIRAQKKIKALSPGSFGLSSGSLIEVISDDTYKIIERPRFKLSRQTFGIESTNRGDKIFEEMNELSPVIYIENPDAIAYPVVFGVESPIDPYSFSGAIEPFALRKVIAGTSTFVGDYVDPEPTGVKGAMSSGQAQMSTMKRSMPCNNFYDSQAREQFSVYEEIAVDDFHELEIAVMPIRVNYVSDAGEKSVPFTDKNAVQQSYNDVSNIEIRNMLIRTAIKADIPTGYPSKDSKSAPCGFEYQKSRGIDSLAFGGLLK